jgi:hypothetical protein
MVIDWPLSMVGDGGVGVPATNAELTVTADDADDASICGDEALSVTCSSNV